MAKGFKMGGGGGNPLNFKVVGNPQPANPKKNTIWVNTDVPIGKWYFDANQPDDLQEGDVWFSVGTSSPVRFNALKKNGIQVYPVSAKQYVSGALVDKEAKNYQGGEWVGWMIYLYKYGDQFSDITGGWSFVQNADGPYSSCAFNDNNISMSTSFSSGVHAAGGSIGTVSMIDLTNIKTIHAVFSNVSCASNLPAYIYAHISNPSAANFATAHAQLSNVSSLTEFTLDVSSLSGLYVVGVGFDYGNGTASSSLTLCEFYLD